MFNQMIHSLRKGELPDLAILEKILAAALIKKLGVLKQPYHCRTQDPKINPPALHLFWAAIILEDEEKIDAAEGIVRTEFYDTAQVRSTAQGNPRSADKVIGDAIRELLSLAPENNFREILAGKAAMHLPAEFCR